MKDDVNGQSTEGDLSSQDTGLQTIHAGFIPLVDCAPLVVAAEKGFAAAEGLKLVLSKEQSWASIRDKVTVGLLDCAHMLGPMTISCSLGVGHVMSKVIAPMALGLNGNAISVSRLLCERMITHGMRAGDVLSGARALKTIIEQDQAAGRPPLTFGVVFPFSSHNYELRSWLAAGGINPDHDVRLVVIPPPMMAANMEQGLIDGFCVGAPWNTVAVEAGLAEIVATKSEIWRNGPEKVLGMRECWANQNAAAMEGLVRALVRSARWVEAPENSAQVAELLAQSQYLNLEARIIQSVLQGAVPRPDAFGVTEVDADFITFARHDATFPWRSHAAWFASQMVKWRQVDPSIDVCAVADQVYRPDLYRKAVAGMDVTPPASDWKTEGGAEAAGQFFGNAAFQVDCQTIKSS